VLGGTRDGEKVTFGAVWKTAMQGAEESVTNTTIQPAGLDSFMLFWYFLLVILFS